MIESDKGLSTLKRKNCWEFMNCGREPGGENSDKIGVCAAALPNKYDGANNGQHTGRFCWVLSGSHCNGGEQGAYAQKLLNCIYCEFFKLVQEEEGRYFIMSPRTFSSQRSEDGYQGLRPDVKN